MFFIYMYVSASSNMIKNEDKSCDTSWLRTSPLRLGAKANILKTHNLISIFWCHLYIYSNWYHNVNLTRIIKVLHTFMSFWRYLKNNLLFPLLKHFYWYQSAFYSKSFSLFLSFYFFDNQYNNSNRSNIHFIIIHRSRNNDLYLV